jgi:hypothetical protein
MANRTEPKTVKQWITYIVMAVIAIWLIIWMLSLSGINIIAGMDTSKSSPILLTRNWR